MPDRVPASRRAALLPLLPGRAPDDVLCRRGADAIVAGRFVAEAAALAERLPTGEAVINLCQDRYRFALGLAAALLRGQTSLLPPNALPATLASLGGDGPLAALVDDDDPPPLPPGLPAVAVTVRDDLPPASALPEVDAGLEAVRLLTSGSTGRPNPHGKRWATLQVNIGAEAQRLAEHLGRADLRGLTVVATVPAQHSYGLESSVLLAMLGGAVFDAGRPFYPADVADALRRVPAPRALVTTPFHLKTVLEAGVELPTADLVVSATAPLTPQLAAAAEQVFGGPLLEIYGCTEAGQVATRRTTATEVWTTFGALRLVRGDTPHGGDAADAPVVVSGGHVEAPTPLADVIELVDDRRFRLLGRSNDLIHVGGKRTSLGHLNHHLNRIPGVRDGAFWMPDDVPGAITRPVAFVVAPGLEPAAVVDALRGEVEDVFLPRRVIHVDALPREATGKLTAGALRAFALRHLDAAKAVPAPAPVASAGDGAVVEVPADHPAFAGHFPGQPILPGVVLLSYVLRAVARDPSARAAVGDHPGVDAVKFLAPVRPGATLAITLGAAPSGLSFEVRDGTGAPVARGRVTASAGGTGRAP